LSYSATDVKVCIFNIIRIFTVDLLQFSIGCPIALVSLAARNPGKAGFMLVSSVFASSVGEFIRHTGGSIPETLGLVIFGMTMFIVSTVIRRRKSLAKPPNSLEKDPLVEAKLQSHSTVALRSLQASDVEIPKQLASL
jgi:hypothetical protein